MARSCVVLLCVALAGGCTQEFAEAMAVAAIEGTLQSLPGVLAPGRYEVRRVSAKLAPADFAGNDDGRRGAPELFVIVKHRGRLILSTRDLALIKQDSFSVTFANSRFQADWQRGDQIEIEVWDEDLAAPDRLVRWVSTDSDAPLFGKRLVTANGSEVVFSATRLR